MNNSTYLQNNANLSGGAIHLSNFSIYNVSNATRMSKNSAANGGAFYISLNDSVLF
jgi:predicted outer membrane repeat protein